jgi:hypothetical protein
MEIAVFAVGIVILILVFISAVLIMRKLSSITARMDKDLVRKRDLGDLDEFLERYDRDINFLSTLLTRQSHTHQARYEHEFKILTEIWDSLITFRRATSLLKPEITKDSPIKPDEYRKAEILAAFAMSYSQVYIEIEQNRPFYPAAVCEQLLGLIRLMEDEGLDDWGRSPDPHLRGFEPEYWEMGLESKSRIITTIDGICQAIRVRIMGS